MHWVSTDVKTACCKQKVPEDQVQDQEQLSQDGASIQDSWRSSSLIQAVCRRPIGMLRIGMMQGPPKFLTHSSSSMASLGWSPGAAAGSGTSRCFSALGCWTIASYSRAWSPWHKPCSSLASRGPHTKSRSVLSNCVILAGAPFHSFS